MCQDSKRQSTTDVTRSPVRVPQYMCMCTLIGLQTPYTPQTCTHKREWQQILEDRSDRISKYQTCFL